MLVTRLELFIRRHGLRPAELTRAAHGSRQHLLRLRQGAELPTRRYLLALVEGAQTLVQERVTPDMLFERGDAFIRAGASRLSHLFADELQRLADILTRAADEDLLAAVAAARAESETAVAYLLATAQPLVDQRPKRAAQMYAAAMVMASSLSGSAVELVAALTGEALKGSANALRQLGKLPQALTDLHVAGQEFLRAKVCPLEAGCVEYTAATVHLFMEDWDAATSASRRARQHFLAAGERRLVAHATLLDGAVAFERGDVDRARIIFDGLRKTFAGGRDDDALGRVWANLAACDIRRGDAKTARHWLNRASAMFRKRNNTTEFLRTRWSMGLYLLTFGDGQHGRRLLRRVERAFRDLGMDVDAACVGLDLLESLLDGSVADPAALAAQGRRIAETMLRAGMRVSTARAIDLLRTIRTPDDARYAVRLARADLRTFSRPCSEVGGAADLGAVSP